MSAETWAEQCFARAVAQNRRGIADRMAHSGVKPEEFVVVPDSMPTGEAADRAAYRGGRPLAVVSEDRIDLYRIRPL